MASLTAEHLTHPLDRQGFQRLIARVGGSVNRLVAGEEDFFLINLADNTRLSDKQGASIYQRVERLAGKLGMPVPHVFLDSQPGPRSSSLCGQHPSLVLSSGLLDRLDGAVLDVAIAHELGHILCGHSFYRLIAEQYDQLAGMADSLLPIIGKVITGGYRLSLFDWYRKSDLSADRAALVATDQPEAVRQYLMDLAGGSLRLEVELDAEAFRQQARDLMAQLKERQSGIAGKVSFFVSGLASMHTLSTHPWPAVRMLELDRWLESDHYRLLRAGKFEEALAVPDQLPQTDQDPTVVAGQDVVGFFKGVGRSATSAVRGLFGAGSEAPPPEPDDDLA